MNHSEQFAPRYEALFNVSDSLREYRDIRELLQVLPLQLQPVLDFDYMSVFLNDESSNGTYWYVLDDEQSALTLARDVPLEQAHVSWAFEHQQPAVVRKLDDGEARFSGSRRLTYRKYFLLPSPSFLNTSSVATGPSSAPYGIITESR